VSRVLIVEDAPYIREVFRYALELHKHVVAGEAVNGVEAVDKYRELKPDVVLMDLLMPVMDGISAIRKIIEFDPKAKIIVVSAISKESIRDEAMSAGAIDFVTKPFDVKRLLLAVREACVP
jgi:two-component system chemotaxis response regulator CheY